jgi:hypothetical protein
MLNLKTDKHAELTYADRKRIHNLKYYTWVEQQGKNVQDLNAQWYDTKEHLGRRPRAGQGSGRADRRVQRRHRPAEEACKSEYAK